MRWTVQSGPGAIGVGFPTLWPIRVSSTSVERVRVMGTYSGDTLPNASRNGGKRGHFVSWPTELSIVPKICRMLWLPVVVCERTICNVTVLRTEGLGLGTVPVNT